MAHLESAMIEVLLTRQQTRKKITTTDFVVVSLVDCRGQDRFGSHMFQDPSFALNKQLGRTDQSISYTPHPYLSKNPSTTMPYRSLIGKTAPVITLPNYDGKSYTFTPGEKGVPTALFFYPESGIIGTHE